jgi:Carboxypeptidase regulatory-like domain
MQSAQLCLRGILLFVCLTLLLSTAHAQYRAGIQGIIIDPEGAAVGAATVTLTSKDTNISKTATSDSSGIYNFLSLAPGQWGINPFQAW